MAFQEDRERKRPRKSDPDTAKPSSEARRRRTGSSDVGQALRTVYDRTVDEAIPPEMLDLLGKLG